MRIVPTQPFKEGFTLFQPNEVYRVKKELGVYFIGNRWARLAKGKERFRKVRKQ